MNCNMGSHGVAKILQLLSLVLIVAGALRGQEVRRSPESGTLSDRWAWALGEARALNRTGGVWIGYSIMRPMGEDSWIGSFSSIPEKDDVTLYELVTGQKIDFESSDTDRLRSAARKALSKTERRQTERKILKEIAILFEFRGDPVEPGNLRDIKVSNVTLTVDLDGLPLLWLGRVPDIQSVDHLKSFRAKVTSRRGSERIVQAIGLHGNAPGVFGFLQDILAGDEQSAAKEDAVFWIGRLDTMPALKLLTGVARSTGELRLAEKAVFSISLMALPQATDVLIDLGRNGPTREIRKKAVFWLGQRASEAVADTLQAMVYNDRDEEIQKAAVFALTQLPDLDGVTTLIRVAKTHPNPRIRKQAVFWLGESDDPRAFDAIVEIARGKP